MRRNSPTWGLPCAVAALLITTALATSAADAAQTTATISMTPPAAAVKFHGPPIVATRPGAPFLYTVAATGTTPITFSATGLPAGLMLNASNGQITGSVATAGNSTVMLHASNAAGSDDKTLVIAVGTSLAPTPPMGWNSYDSYGATVTEAEVLAEAQAQATVLQPFGWSTVVVDYLWFDPEDTLDANGRYLPSITRFPSATGQLGFKPLADKIHAMGLNFGIHIMRGVPRTAVTARLPIANSTTFTTADAGNTADPCPWDSHMWGASANIAAAQAWYDSIFAQYAQWGIDFVKVDDMIKNNTPPTYVYHQSEVDAIHAAFSKTTRAITFSLSPGPMQTVNAVDLAANANMWRMVNDFWDVNGLSTVADVFTASAAWQAVPNLGVGHWPDADMLPLGDLAPRCPVHASGPTALTRNQQVQVMSLWAILPSPLIFGGNMPSLTTDTAIGPWTTALLTNDEVLAVNQDASGTHGKQVLVSGTTEVWTRDLAGGAKAVALFNRGTQDATVAATFAQLGVTGIPTVRDLWHRVDITGMTTGVSLNVPWNSAMLLLLQPPVAVGTDAGAGDASDSGAGGSAGGSDGAGSGGAAGTGTGGSSSTGGASGDTGTGVGGDMGPGAGGAAGTPVVSKGGGCACAVAAPVGSASTSALVGLLLALVACRARPRARARRAGPCARSR